MNLLLVEDDDSLAEALQDVLEEESRVEFRVKRVSRLADALDVLRAQKVHLVLLDLNLPDAQGLEAPRTLRDAAADLPIVVLTGAEDDRLVEENARVGVQDFLLKRELNRNLLIRTIRYAIERNRLLQELKDLSLKDELTGLYNRRGFFTVAEQQLKVAERLEKPVLVFFFDVDGLKDCNDDFGHAHGDALLLKASRILRSTFRDSDVIARFGGDEFAVLSLDVASESVDLPLARLERDIQQENLGEPGCPVALSVGYSTFVPSKGRSLEDLVHEADQMMYFQKRQKQKDFPGRDSDGPE